jgi:C4-dicarboxylate transporter
VNSDQTLVADCSAPKRSQRSISHFAMAAEFGSAVVTVVAAMTFATAMAIVAAERMVVRTEQTVGTFEWMAAATSDW